MSTEYLMTSQVIFVCFWPYASAHNRTLHVHRVYAYLNCALAVMKGLHMPLVFAIIVQLMCSWHGCEYLVPLHQILTIFCACRIHYRGVVRGDQPSFHRFTRLMDHEVCRHYCEGMCIVLRNMLLCCQVCDFDIVVLAASNAIPFNMAHVRRIAHFIESGSCTWCTCGLSFWGWIKNITFVAQNPLVIPWVTLLLRFSKPAPLFF